MFESVFRYIYDNELKNIFELVDYFYLRCHSLGDVENLLATYNETCSELLTSFAKDNYEISLTKICFLDDFDLWKISPPIKNLSSEEKKRWANENLLLRLTFKIADKINSKRSFDAFLDKFSNYYTWEEDL